MILKNQSKNPSFIRILITSYKLIHVLNTILLSTDNIRKRHLILNVCLQFVKYPHDVVESLLRSDILTIFMGETDLGSKTIANFDNDIYKIAYKRDCNFLICI